MISPVPARLSLSTSAFWLALAGYIAVALAFQGFVFGARTSPPEPDDAYTYIVKSAQLAEGCALQDCPALNSLRAQLQTASPGEEAEWRRYRFSGRVFLVYHPLYSVLLLGANQLSLSWESGFMALAFLGVTLIGAGMAFFLLALCGPLATALALGFLTFSIFPGQGLTYIVPSNIALGLAFFALGFALRGWRWALTAAILLMLLTHPVGKVYSCVALIVAMMTERDFRLEARRLAPYLTAIVLIGASVLAPMLIERPVLRVEPEPLPAGFTMAGGLLANVLTAAEMVSSGYGREPALGIPLTLILYLLAWRGYRQAPEPVRRKFRIVGLALGGMCGALLLHVLPRYPAEAFLRGWIALAVVIAGAAALAIVGPEGLLRRPAPAGASPSRWRDPARLCMGFLAVFAISGSVVLIQRALNMRDRHYQTFEPDQVRLLAQRCGTAIYAPETAALFYLSHGANACSAAYLPALGKDSSAVARLKSLPPPFMLVAQKPGPREIAITHRQPAEITIRDRSVRKLHLTFAPPAPWPPLRIRVTSSGGADAEDIAPTGPDGTVALDLAPSAETVVTISTPSRFAKVFLEGMRIDGEMTDWPWNHDITLRIKRRLYGFDAAALTSGMFSAMEVIDSRGSTVLAKLPWPN